MSNTNPKGNAKVIKKRIGRPPGSQNIITSNLKVAISEAAASVGFDGHGLNGTLGYMQFLAMTEPKTFATLLARAQYRWKSRSDIRCQRHSNRWTRFTRRCANITCQSRHCGWCIIIVTLRSKVRYCRRYQVTMSLVELIPASGEIKTREDYDHVVQLWHAQARDSFWAFRKFMRPDMVWGWFVEDVALHQ